MSSIYIKVVPTLFIFRSLILVNFHFNAAFLWKNVEDKTKRTYYEIQVYYNFCPQ